MSNYVHNVIPGIPRSVCGAKSLVNTVMTNCSTKGISSLDVSKSGFLSLSLALCAVPLLSAISGVVIFMEATNQ